MPIIYYFTSCFSILIIHDFFVSGVTMLKNFTKEYTIIMRANMLLLIAMIAALEVMMAMKQLKLNLKKKSALLTSGCF